MKSFGFKTNIELIELCDAFSRHAEFKQPETVKALVRETTGFMRLLEGHVYPDVGQNKELAAKAQKKLAKMAALSQELGADELELPIADASVIREFVQKKILNGLKSPVRISFQKAQYNTDLSSIGPIDPRIKTPLNNIGWVADVESTLKASW